MQQLATQSSVTVVFVSPLLVTPAVIFWIWMVIQPAKGATECPEECRCDTYSYLAYMVNCSGSSLNSIPSTLPTHLHKLVLDGNNITYFENDRFVSRGLVELLVIQTDFCKIRKIELEAFTGLTNLTNLSIQGNEISEIIIIIITFIYCNWVVTRWQWLFYK